MEKIIEILNWLQQPENYYLVALFLLLVLEVFFRYIPTTKDISILNALYLYFDKIVKNRGTKVIGKGKRVYRHRIKRIKNEE